jgi:hypothetical protein
MKLNELVGVKKFIGMNSTEVLDFLKNTQGKLKPLGSGANAAALTDGTDVYKFWLIDSAYDKFIKYVQANQQNPFLPKLKSAVKTIPAFFLRHKNAPDKIKYIKMEKLSPVEYVSSYYYSVSPGFEEKLNIYDAIDAIEALPRRASFAEVLENLKNSISKKPFTINEDAVAFLKTMYEIYALVGGGAYIDFHDGNFMLRGDQLVFLDPLANGDDVDLNDQFLAFDKQHVMNMGRTKIGKIGARRTKDADVK